MSLHKRLTAVTCTLALACALMLALGLAACDSGDDTPKTMDEPDPAAVQLAAVVKALKDARAAVEALAGESTDDEVAAAGKLVAAAKAALAGAAALSADVKAAYGTAVAVIERSLADARAARTRTMAEDAEALFAALGGPRISSVAATVKHGAAPRLSGTVPGTPAAVAGLETTAVAGSVSAVGGWSRGTYTAADGDAGTRDTVVLYTDIEPTGSQPFGGEGGKYGSGNGLDGDGNLPIAAGTDAALIASPAFPTAAGIRTHAAGEDGTVSVAGTFDGAQGAYVCEPAEASPCTSSIRQGGGIALAGGGGWKFVPEEGATVAKPDEAYRYFGWWLRRGGEVYAIGAFHGGEGDAANEFAGLAALQGTVTYRGPAVGKFAIVPLIGTASSGDFVATATLEADFGDGSDSGTVEGAIDGFTVDGEAMPWSVALKAAAIGAGGVIAAGGTATADTVWSIGDREGAASGSPTWEGRFHEAEDDRVPSVATGTFDAAFGDVGRMTGAFGADRQP